MGAVGSINAIRAVALISFTPLLLLDLFHGEGACFVNGRSLARAKEVGDVASQLVLEAGLGELAVEGAFDVADAVA